MFRHRMRLLLAKPLVSARKDAQFRANAGSGRGSRIAQSPAHVSPISSPFFDASAQSSDLRVEKSRAEATITLSNGSTVRGCFFTSHDSRTHTGPERIKDVLNGETGFFPFEMSGKASTALYNRDHVVLVELTGTDDPRSDPGYELATEKVVAVLLSTGTRLRGAVRVYRPHGADRLSDFTRAGETFVYLEAPAAAYLFNVRHVLELAEETHAA